MRRVRTAAGWAGLLLAGLLAPRPAPPTDQCALLKALIANLNAQLAVQQGRLKSPECSGSARLECARSIQALTAQIRNETNLLTTCVNGVIPTTGDPAPPPHLPFDMLPRFEGDYDHSASGFNPRWDYLNGIPKNPLWASQLYDKQLPNPTAQCNASSLSYHASDWLGCTSDPVWINAAKCAGGGHVNWQPVTYDGTISWSEHSSNDDDYNIDIRRDDQALYNTSGSDHVGMEWDSDETIDRVVLSPWWKQMHTDVDNGSDNPQNIFGLHATVIGLPGLDYVHDSFTELHPLYALAINFAPNRWAFFVRNWGDEGYCSQGSNPWRVQTIRVLLPNPFAEDGKAFANNVWLTPAATIGAFFLKGQGEVLEINLPPPGDEGLVMGEVTVTWTGLEPAWVASTVLPPSHGSSRLHKEGTSDSESRMSEFLARLPATERRDFARTVSKTHSAGSVKSGVVAQLPKQTDVAMLKPIVPAAVQLTPNTPEQQGHVKALCAAVLRRKVSLPDLCMNSPAHPK